MKTAIKMVPSVLLAVFLSVLSRQADAWICIGCQSFRRLTKFDTSPTGYRWASARFPVRIRRTKPEKATLRSVISETAHDSESGFLFADNDDQDVNDPADIDESGFSVDDEGEKTFGLYIHIPYCRQRCRYCDFAIVPIGDHGASKSDEDFSLHQNDNRLKPQKEQQQQQQQLSRREEGFRRMNDRYVSAIVAELKGLAAAQKKNQREGAPEGGKRHKIPLRSIYFGGGTPSLAPIESIKTILYHVCETDNPEAPFRLLQHQQEEPQSPQDEDEDEGEEVDKPVATSETVRTNVAKTEITMEMDPGTFDRDHLSSLRDMGVNRVSLGVQSFDDDLLRAMGRTHRRADILQAVQDIQFVFGETGDAESGGDGEGYDENRHRGWKNVNYSMDLISGCPGLTPAKWVETLQEATAGLDTGTTTDSSSPLLLSSLSPPKHISVYDMQIEEGTVFGKWAAKAKREAEAKRNQGSNTPYKEVDNEDDDPSRRFTVTLPPEDSGRSPGGGRISKESSARNERSSDRPPKERLLRLPSEDDCAFMYKFAAGYLRAKNFEHYEVSSYASFGDSATTLNTKKDSGDRPDIHEQHVTKAGSNRSVHNQIYWEYDGEWFAVGLGATSFVDKKLVARPREMSDYIEWVHTSAMKTNKNDCKAEGEMGIDGVDDVDNDGNDDDDDDDFLSELLLKRLRTIDGLDLNWLEKKYGSNTVKNVLEGANLGLELGLAEHTDDNILRLTDPEGLLYSNFIISSIFAELGYT